MNNYNIGYAKGAADTLEYGTIKYHYHIHTTVDGGDTEMVSADTVYNGPDAPACLDSPAGCYTKACQCKEISHSIISTDEGWNGTCPRCNHYEAWVYGNKIHTVKYSCGTTITYKEVICRENSSTQYLGSTTHSCTKYYPDCGYSHGQCVSAEIHFGE